MAIIRLFLGLIVVFLLVGFSVANMQSVSINFYFYKTPAIPLFVVLFLSLLGGVLIAWGMVLGEQLKLRAEVRRRDRQLKDLEKELKSYEEKLVVKESEKPSEEIVQEKPSESEALSQEQPSS